MTNEATKTGGIAGDRLKSFVERIERLEEEKAALSADIKEVYSECKSVGFDNRVVKRLVSARKKEPHQREEEEQLFELYWNAIGG